jgi:tRNA uridine 5-carboxymethylaminomethyl modification enzyme
LVSEEQWQLFASRRARYETNLAGLNEASVRDDRGRRVLASEWLKQPAVKLADLIDRGDVPFDTSDSTRALDVASVETAIKYAGYLKQERARADRARRDHRRRIPASFPFARVPGLSNEIVQRLTQVRPETLGQASRIPGVTPAAIAVLDVFLTRLAGDSSARVTL